jgi:hypothetical protein
MSTHLFQFVLAGALLAWLLVPPAPAATPTLTAEDARSAIAIATGFEAQRRAFLAQYRVDFPREGNEQAASVEIYTPFRETVERAMRARRLGMSYDDRTALREAQRTPPGVRVVARLVLPLNRIHINNALPFGRSYRMMASYQMDGMPTATVVTEPGHRVVQTCRGIVCIWAGSMTVDGAILETMLPFAPAAVAATPPGTEAAVAGYMDPAGPLTITIAEPTGKSRSAEFDLGNLR